MTYSLVCNEANITDGIKIFLKCVNTFNFITVNTEFQTNTSPTETPLSIRHTSEPPDKMPKWYSVLTNGPRSLTHVRTKTLTFWAFDKMPKQYFVLKRDVCPATHWWTYSVSELLSSSGRTFPFHGGVHISWQSVPSRGETARIPETNGFISFRELSLWSPSEG